MAEKSNSVIVDIIIPAYNAHKTIEKAIASIVTQTLSDVLKVTIVNDGSNADYHRLVERYRNIINIEEITLEKNVGCGMARQAGLEHTYAPYIMFVDADDFFYSPYSVAILLDRMEKNNDLNVMYGAIHSVFLDDGQIQTISPEHFTWLFGSMYRRSLIDKYHITFADSSRGEDVSFNKLFKLLSDGDQNIGYTDEVIYCWTDQNKDARINNEDFIVEGSKEGFVENILYVYDFIKNITIPHKPEELKIDVISNIVSMYFQYLDLCEERPQAAPKLFRYIQKYYNNVYRNYETMIALDDLKDLYNINVRRWYSTKPMPIDGISIYEFINMLQSGNGQNKS